MYPVNRQTAYPIPNVGAAGAYGAVLGYGTYGMVASPKVTGQRVAHAPSRTRGEAGVGWRIGGSGQSQQERFRS